jgi:hypothetical protein
MPDSVETGWVMCLPVLWQTKTATWPTPMLERDQNRASVEVRRSTPVEQIGTGQAESSSVPRTEGFWCANETFRVSSTRNTLVESGTALLSFRIMEVPTLKKEAPTTRVGVVHFSPPL